MGGCFGCGAPVKVPAQGQAVAELDIAFSEGDRVSNRYIIHERVGKGGMGVVYRAHDTLIDEEVALKFMKPQLLRTQKGVMSFIQEAQVARRLRHENIVAVHDISSTENGILYLSMEFLQGMPLRALLRQQRQERRLLDVGFAVRVTAALLAALDHAHRTVIHRDIKPENVMLLPGEHVKVLDFGLARAIDEDQSSAAQAKKGTGVAGTFAYSAPEQKAHRALDQRIDIYATGLVLYELLTLRTPLDPQLDVTAVRNDVAPSIVAVLDRARAEEKESRWSSAHEFRRALLQAFEHSYRQMSPVSYTSDSGVEVSTEEMVFMEGGRFVMGSNSVPEESPEFETFVAPFYIDKYPVRVRDYASFIKATGRPEPRYWHDPRVNGANQPAIGVSLEDAQAYAAWVGKRLPTEAEWEFAARGKENRLFPWGHLEPDSTLCNFGEYLGMPSIVTMHLDGKTPEGVCDMGGNVYEWTPDPFAPYAARQAGDATPQTPLRVVRGGCWKSPANELRCSFRKGLFPETQLDTVGFRCVLPAPGPSA